MELPLTPDVDEIASIGSITGNELGDNCHFLGGVDLKLLVPAIVILIAHAEGVEVASILVAHAFVT